MKARTIKALKQLDKEAREAKRQRLYSDNPEEAKLEKKLFDAADKRKKEGIS